MFTLKRDTTAQNTPARPTSPKIKAHDTSSNLIQEANVQEHQKDLQHQQ